MRRGTAPRARRPGRRPGPLPPARLPAGRRPTGRTGGGCPAGGVGTPSCSLTASKTTLSQGLRSRGPQTVIAARPPGRRMRRISRAAAAGSGTSMSPSRHSTTSNEESGSSMCSMSSTRAETFRRPRSEAWPAAIAVISDAKSEMTTSPPGATSGAASSPGPPVPQASSRTRSPGARPCQVEHPLGDMRAAGCRCRPGGRPTLRRRRTTSGAAGRRSGSREVVTAMLMVLLLSY